MQEKLIIHKLMHVSVYTDKMGYTEMEVKQDGKKKKSKCWWWIGTTFGSMFCLKGNESLGMPDSEVSIKTKSIQ